MAGGKARQETGSDEFGAGVGAAVGVVVATGGVDEGAAGEEEGVPDPQAAMRRAANEASSRYARGMGRRTSFRNRDGTMPVSLR
jgi:hypothetical protein